MTTLECTRATSERGIGHTVFGTGPPVVLLAPAATRGDIWRTHQVAPLVGLGHQVVCLDARGCPPSVSPSGPFGMSDLVADVAGVITELGGGPARVVGASLGAMVAQELCLARPDLVHSAALLGTRCRADVFRRAAARASVHRLRSGPVPTASDAESEAVSLMTQLFSPRTFDDDAAAADWLALYATFPLRGEGLAAQYQVAADYGATTDRAAALTAIRTPCLVVGFEHDLVTPPAACRAVAGAIPGAVYREIPGCGHFGFLERPDLVNITLAGFLRN